MRPKSHNANIATKRRPLWNESRRELLVGETIAKRFREPAPYQELILRTFEELSWPARIDDPLPGGLDEAHAKQRLHDTIKRLNRGHINSVIRFHGDGTGTGLWWEFV